MFIEAVSYLALRSPMSAFRIDLLEQPTALINEIDHNEEYGVDGWLTDLESLSNRPFSQWLKEYIIISHLTRYPYRVEKNFSDVNFSILTHRSYLEKFEFDQYSGSVEFWDGVLQGSRYYCGDWTDYQYSGISHKQFLLALHTYLTQKENTMSKTKNFIDAYLNILPYIDPDSPRFVDWMCGERMKSGLTTTTKHTRLTNPDGQWKIDDVIKSQLTKDQLIEMNPQFGQLTQHVYKSNGFYRLYIIERVAETKWFMRKEYDVIRFCVVVGRTESEITVVAVGEENWVNATVARMEEDFKIPASITVRTLVDFGQNGPVVMDSVIREDDHEQYLAKDEFYPFIEGGIKKLAEDFKKSRASILIFIGPPGVGKSTLLRTLMFYMKYSNNAAISNEVVLQNPSALPWIQSQEKDTFLMIEDADNMCKPRSTGNYQMSGLLNHADGIVHVGSKIGLSTNLPTLRDVDEALIRKGRAFKVITFVELTFEQANTARRSIGMGVIPEAHYKESWTLSDALNWSEEDPVSEKRTSVGFVLN